MSERDDDQPNTDRAHRDARPGEGAARGLKGRQFGGPRRAGTKPPPPKPALPGAASEGDSTDEAAAGSAEPSTASSTGGGDTTGPGFGATKSD